MKKRTFFTAAVAAIAGILATTQSSKADQTTLSAGDIVFLQAQSDTPDTFAFSPLVNIGKDTLIFFTEAARMSSTPSSWSDWRLGTGGNFNEGVYAYVAPSDIAAGTVVTLNMDGVGDWGLAASGDNLFAFQGTPQAPQFLAALGWDVTTSFISTGSPTANNTYLPSSLTIGTNAMQIGATGDNVAYSGTATGSATTLRTAINTASNWTKSDTVGPVAPGSLVVSGAISGSAATSQIGGYGFGQNSASYTTAATVTPNHTTLGSFGTRQGSVTLDVDGGNGSISQDFQVGNGTASGLSTSSTLDLSTTSAVGFTMTIDVGFQLDLERMEFAYQRGADGPTTLALYASNDGFATSFQIGSNITLGDANVGVANFTDATLNTYTGALEFRFYAWNAANGATSTLELDEVYFTANVASVPEPSTWAILGVGASLLIRFRHFRTVIRSRRSL